MEAWIRSQDLWDMVDQSYLALASKEEEEKYTDAQKRSSKNAWIDKQAALDLSRRNEVWDILESSRHGIGKTMWVRLQVLQGEFESLKMNESKSVFEYFTWTMLQMNLNLSILNKLGLCKSLFMC